MCVAHQDQWLGTKRQKETFNDLRGRQFAGGGDGQVCCLLRAGFQEAVSVSVSRGWGKGTGQHQPWPPRLQAHVHKGLQNCKKQTRGSSHVACRTPEGRSAGLGLHPPPSQRQETGWHGHPQIHTSDNHLQGTGRPGLTPTFQRFPHSLQTTAVVMGSSELRVCTCGGGL